MSLRHTWSAADRVDRVLTIAGVPVLFGGVLCVTVVGLGASGWFLLSVGVVMILVGTVRVGATRPARPRARRASQTEVARVRALHEELRALIAELSPGPVDLSEDLPDSIALTVLTVAAAPSRVGFSLVCHEGHALIQWREDGRFIEVHVGDDELQQPESVGRTVIVNLLRGSPGLSIPEPAHPRILAALREAADGVAAESRLTVEHGWAGWRSANDVEMAAAWHTRLVHQATGRVVAELGLDSLDDLVSALDFSRKRHGAWTQWPLDGTVPEADIVSDAASVLRAAAVSSR